MFEWLEKMYSKYPELSLIEDPYERQQFFLEELEMNVGQAFSALDKSWKGYKIAKQDHDIDRMEEYAGKVQRIQRGMGLDVASFYYITPKNADPEL